MRFTSFDPLDNQEVVDEHAAADLAWEKAYDNGFAFAAAMGRSPQWALYGE